MSKAQDTPEAVEITLTVIRPGLYGKTACEAGDVITVDNEKRAKQLVERGDCSPGGRPKKSAKKPAAKKPTDDPGKDEGGEPPTPDDTPDPEANETGGKKKPTPKK